MRIFRAAGLGPVALAVAATAGAGLIDNQALAAEDETQRAISFSGVDFAKDAKGYYSGGIVALNGDLGRDGFVLMAMGSANDFEYRSSDVVGGLVDGDETAINVMIGYQKTIGLITATGYVGVDYTDIDLSPNDPTNEVQGSETGFKVALEAETSDEIPFFASASSSYSTAFETFDAMLRLGYNMKWLVVGPEATYSSVEGDGSERVGGFATYRFNLSPSMPAEITANLGYQFVDSSDDGVDDEGVNTTQGGEGMYGGAGLSFSF